MLHKTTLGGFIVVAIMMAASLGESGEITYRGWKRSREFRGGDLRAVVVPQIGGRVMFFGFIDGENVLWEDDALAGKVLRPDATDWRTFRPGGCQLDVLPYTAIKRDGRAYVEFWAGPYEVTEETAHSITMRSSSASSLGFHVVKTISMPPAAAGLVFEQKLVNHSNHELTLALWDRTWTRIPDEVAFPLADDSGKRKTWDFTENHKRWRDIPKILKSGQFSVVDDEMVIHYKGLDCQVVADCDKGWIQWRKGPLTFKKHFPFDKLASYAQEGRNLSVYVSPPEMSMVELEPSGPLMTLKPGESATFNEHWTLERSSKP